MLWFYMHLPHLYAESWHTPFEQQQPTILIKEHGSYVVDANQAAHIKGVEKGMLVNTAFCLAPEMNIFTISPHREIKALSRVAKYAYRFSAWIGLDFPDGIYLEVASMRKFFGGLAQLKAEIETLFQELGHRFHIAAAPTPKGARLLARNGIEACVDEFRLREMLKQLPTECLELPPPVLLRLQKLGLKTVHDVIQLPVGDLAYRVDRELALYLSQVLGLQKWRPEPFVMPEDFQLKVDMEQEFESLNPLLFPMASAVKRFCHFLQNRCLVGQQLTIKLIHRSHPETTVPVHLATADNRVDAWTYMLSMQIERIKLPAPVTGFQLEATEFEEIPPSSLILFQNTGGAHEDKKAFLLNRLAARIGTERLQFVGLSDDARPEKQTLYNSQPLQPQPPPENMAMGSPIWLLPQPREVDIRQYRLIRGPLRLNSGWWDSASSSREYYIATTSSLPSQALEALPSETSIALHWLFRTSSNQWYIHGIYA